MSTNSLFAKFLRFTGIVLMALTSGFTLLGGIGTSCAAFFPANFPSMSALSSLQWLYIVYVLVGIALGILGIRATVQLVKGLEGSYQRAMLVLVAGTAIGVVHIITSRMLRGKSMPVDAVVYTTVLTLILFLLFRIPSIWQGVDFSKGKPASNRPAGGVAAIILGLFTLTIQYTMGPTHFLNRVNYADAFHTSMAVSGWSCLLFGVGVLALPWLSRIQLHVSTRLMWGLMPWSRQSKT